jgi:hypothetical protein
MTIQEQIKLAKAQLQALQSQVVSKTFSNKITVKIGEKGTVNVYGLGKFPVCLYLSQLQKLQTTINSPDFSQFLMENMDKIAQKKEE